MDGNTLTKGLTGYEKPIYDFLAQNDAWISLKELGYMFFGEDDWDGIRPFHNTAARRKITQAIHNINASDAFEKLIIHGDKGVKTATAEEAARYINARFAESLKQLKQTYKLAEKAGLNNQTQVIGETINSFA